MREKCRIGWKLMPYGTNLQLQLVCFVIIGFVGLSWEFFQAAFDNNLNVVSFCGGDLGGFFLMLSGTFLAQFVLASMRSTLIQTSPYKKTMHTGIAPFYNFLGCAIGFTICVVSHIVMYVRFVRFPQEQKVIETRLLLVAFWGTIIMVYGAIAFKYYVLSIASLYVCMLVGIQFDVSNLVSKMPGNLPLVILGGYVMIMIGGIIQTGISKLIYKKELSEWAFTTAWQRGK